MPGLLDADAETFLLQCGLLLREVVGVVAFLVADQQVQMRLGHSGDQFGAFERQTLGVLGVHHHQNAAYGLHERLPVLEVLECSPL